MSHIILASLAAFGLILWPAPAYGTVIVSPTLAYPVRVKATDQDERPDTAPPPNWGDWVWEYLIDHLTVPLGPADQNIWPPLTGRQQWIVMAYRGGLLERASDEQTSTEHGLLPPTGGRIVSTASAVRTSMRVAGPKSQTSPDTGEHTCEAP